MATAFNVVRFRAKPGHEKALVEAHRKAHAEFRGFRHGYLVKGDKRHYVFVGEWSSHAAIVAARPKMIDMLDTFREHLQDLGDGLGMTDPLSGDVVAQVKPAKARKTTRPVRPVRAAARKKTTRGRRAVHAA